jgi:hypothetical protein
MQQFVGNVAASARRGRDGTVLPLIPIAILRDKRSEPGLGSSGIYKLTETIHRYIDALNIRWRHVFHFSLGNLAGTHGPALMGIVYQRFGGHTVPHGKFESIAVLQVCHPFIPVVAVQATQVRPGNKGLVTMDLQLGLEGKRLIA